MFDLNNAAPQMGPMGELIPDGSFVKLRMTIRPGGADGLDQADAGMLKASKSSDAKMLDCEFVVLEGPYAKRKFWENMVVNGGKRNEKGDSIGWNITKSTIRAMIESALGLDPKDMSEAARQKRVLKCFKHLDGITFAGRVMIEPATSADYNDQNKLANVVLPNEPQYPFIMKGQPVDPDPVNAKPRKDKPASTGGGGQTGGWQQQQGPQSQLGAQATAEDAPAWLTGG
jgi:hypothetical protein